MKTLPNTLRKLFGIGTKPKARPARLFPVKKLCRSAITSTLLLAAIATGLLTATPVHAEGYAGRAGAFLRMGAGATTLAGGDAAVARAVGAEQAHYNAAGLPYSPSNEVHAGYHVLSLDRQLYHVGALYQVPSLSFWSAPIEPLEVLPADEDHPHPRLVEPGTGLVRRPRQLKVDDYLDPLTDIILQLAQDETLPPPFLLTIKGTDYEAPVLEAVILETAAEAQQRGLETTDEIQELLRERYTSQRVKPAAVVVNWTHAGVTDIEGRGFDGRRYGTLSFHENRFALAFGLKLHPKVSIGTNVGILYALIPDMLEEESKALTSTNIGVDIGVQVRPFLDNDVPYRLETLVLGAGVYDLGGKYTWNTTGYWSQGTTQDDLFPRRYRAGFSYMPISGLEVYLDLETDLDLLLRAKGGLEYRLFGSLRGDAGLMHSGMVQAHGFVVRAGWDRDRPSLGLGLDIKLRGLGITRLDYAFVVAPVSPEPTQVISWRFRF